MTGFSAPYFLAGAAVTALAVHDARTRHIPNVAVLPAIAVALVWHHAPGHLIGAAVLGAWLLLLALTGVAGGGDWKMAAFVGLIVGAGWPMALIVMSVAGLAVALFLLVTHRRKPGDSIAFGPFLALGGIAAMAMEAIR